MSKEKNRGHKEAKKPKVLATAHSGANAGKAQPTIAGKKVD